MCEIDVKSFGLKAVKILRLLVNRPLRIAATGDENDLEQEYAAAQPRA
jgi:hypothetical protein